MALLGYSMIRETDDRILIKPGPWNERIALLLFVAGIMGGSLYFFGYQVELKPFRRFFIYMLFIGISVLFVGERWIFDRKLRRIARIYAFRRDEWSFDEIERIEFNNAPMHSFRLASSAPDCVMVLKDGKRIRIKLKDIGESANHLAGFLAVPCSKQ